MKPEFEGVGILDFYLSADRERDLIASDAAAVELNLG